MAAEVGENVNEQSQSFREAGLQVGFTPSPKLDTALRGFLLPERSPGSRRDRSETGRIISEITLRSLIRQDFRYDASANDGIRYDNEGDLMEEKARLKGLRGIVVPVADIRLGFADNEDVVVELRLRPSDSQRKALSGFVLGNLLRDDHKNLDVYTRFSHIDVESDKKKIIAQAKQIKRTLTRYHELKTQEPMMVIPDALYVQAPQIIEADLAPPRIIL